MHRVFKNQGKGIGRSQGKWNCFVVVLSFYVGRIRNAIGALFEQNGFGVQGIGFIDKVTAPQIHAVVFTLPSFGQNTLVGLLLPVANNPLGRI